MNIPRLALAAAVMMRFTLPSAAQGATLAGAGGDPLTEPASLSSLHERIPPPAKDENSWQWRVAPYLWGASIDGSVTAANTEVDFNVDLQDLFDKLEIGALVFAEARKGQFAFLGDVIYMDLGADGETPGGGDADADVTMTVLDFAALYRFTATSPYEIGIGMRYASMDTDVEVGPLSADGSLDVLDGVAVGRATWPFAERWNVMMYGDVGTGDSDLTWQAAAMLGYRIKNWGLTLGYRLLDYDVKQGSDEIDLTLEGLLFGVEFRF